MNNKKRIFLLLILCFFVGFFTSRNIVHFDYRTITTDSGFDSSFDSGSSSSSSSDSSWSSDSGSSGGSSIAKEEQEVFKHYFPNGFNFKDYFRFLGSPEYFVLLIEELFFHAFLGIFIYCFILNNKKKIIIYESITTSLIVIFPTVTFFLLEFLFFIIFMFRVFKRPTKDESNIQEIDLTKFNINKDLLHKEIYDIYVRVQEAWSTFTLENVKDVLSDEIYNMYESQLATLKTKNEKNVMSDFKYINCTITSIREDEDKNTKIIVAALEVNCKDYLVNSKNNKLLRGNKNIHDYLYELRFKMSDKTNVENCPNCNAKLEDLGSSVTCKYCGTKINRDSTNLVLIKKQMLRQR